MKVKQIHQAPAGPRLAVGLTGLVGSAVDALTEAWLLLPIIVTAGRMRKC